MYFYFYLLYKSHIFKNVFCFSKIQHFIELYSGLDSISPIRERH